MSNPIGSGSPASRPFLFASGGVASPAGGQVGVSQSPAGVALLRLPTGPFVPVVVPPGPSAQAAAMPARLHMPATTGQGAPAAAEPPLPPADDVQLSAPLQAVPDGKQGVKRRRISESQLPHAAPAVSHALRAHVLARLTDPQTLKIGMVMTEPVATPVAQALVDCLLPTREPSVVDLNLCRYSKERVAELPSLAQSPHGWSRLDAALREHKAVVGTLRLPEDIGNLRNTHQALFDLPTRRCSVRPPRGASNLAFKNLFHGVVLEVRFKPKDTGRTLRVANSHVVEARFEGDRWPKGATARRFFETNAILDEELRPRPDVPLHVPATGQITWERARWLAMQAGQAQEDRPAPDGAAADGKGAPVAPKKSEQASDPVTEDRRLLELPEGPLTREIVSKAFRTRSAPFHPDKHVLSPQAVQAEAMEIFKRLGNARDRLLELL